jgi:hypothetical protein
MMWRAIIYVYNTLCIRICIYVLPLTLTLTLTFIGNITHKYGSISGNVCTSRCSLWYEKLPWECERLCNDDDRYLTPYPLTPHPTLTLKSCTFIFIKIYVWYEELSWECERLCNDDYRYLLFCLFYSPLLSFILCYHRILFLFMPSWLVRMEYILL